MVSGKATSFYNLKSKGVWQKLDIEFYCNNNEKEVPVFICCSKRGAKDFSKLKGYIIFAYPLCEKIKIPDSLLAPGTSQSKRDNTEMRYEISPSATFPLNKQKYSGIDLFCFPLSVLQSSVSLKDGPDPIRNWASKFISEDTTYYPYKANIVLETTSNQLTESRLLRWQFGWQIFTKEYNWSKRIFGGGFGFLNWYGYYFLKDKTKSDWPHNPLLSILLYSGTIGLTIYLFFLYKVCYYYIKYSKEYPLMFIFFLITFFFTFFSGGSPFDPPLMGFFVILPFFIHSVHKKSNIELINI
jgi:hypothetical protein